LKILLDPCLLCRNKHLVLDVDHLGLPKKAREKTLHLHLRGKCDEAIKFNML
jgi:hypothetical protein